MRLRNDAKLTLLMIPLVALILALAALVQWLISG